jgi:predicted methyltransferase
MRFRLPAAAAAWLALSSPLLAQAPAAYVAAAVASADRPVADTDRDAARHPAELIAFAGLKPGDRVADIMPGGGYFTRIFSKVVGPRGQVFAVVPTELAQVAPKVLEGVKAMAAEGPYANVTVLVQPTAAIAPPAPLDLAWTSDNYHDLYGFLGADHAAALDAAVFKALKPGGIFIVVDHAAKPGTSDVSAETLHRIDPETVRAQALAAGFVLDAQSDILRNPADTHEDKVFAPAIRGHTDQFVFRFRKPG